MSRDSVALFWDLERLTPRPASSKVQGYIERMRVLETQTYFAFGLGKSAWVAKAARMSDTLQAPTCENGVDSRETAYLFVCVLALPMDWSASRANPGRQRVGDAHRVGGV
jgi:hypothetical protein